MKLNMKCSVNRHAGFTLVEIMVGMVVGLLVTLVIVQVMSAYEGQRRSTTGTADAQTNGAIALFNIGRELQLAGYGLIPTDDTNSPLECATVTPGAAAAAINNLAPVSIANGAVSDTITVRYGDSVLGGIPTLVKSVTGKAIGVTSNLSCKDGDFVIVTKGANCAVTKLAATTDVPTGILGDVTINLKSSEAVPSEVTADNSAISCLGDWHIVSYAVNNGTLQKGATNNVTGVVNFQDSAADIVNIQAQYGISNAANSNQVTAWVEATNTAAVAGNWNAPSVPERNRIKAIRIAVIARNPKLEPAAVSTACNSTTAAAPTGLCAWAGTNASPAPAVDLSADANWARYRYRVYETIIPLRNMIWSKDTL